jgi:hypothetical protein
MTATTKLPVSKLFEEAIRNYELALKTGIQLQEESTKLWREVLTETPNPLEFQEKLDALATDAFPTLRKKMEESVELVQANTKTSMELFHKAVEVYQASSFKEGQGKVLDLWDASLGALRANVNTMVKTNTEIINYWTKFVAPAAAAKSEKK